jgi:hypothetical protein
MKKLISLFLLLFSVNAFSAGSAIEIPKYDWSWKGFFWNL